ncbi:MAG: hypothetical protein NVSMB9_19950 [Isosphaeraceae bacterium]
MVRRDRLAVVGLAFTLALPWGGRQAFAQYSEVDGGNRPRIYGGRPGVSSGRYQPGLISPPGMNLGPSNVAVPAPLPEVNAPLITPTLPGSASSSNGPQGGITLDEALGLLLHNNLDLRAQFSGIAQAEADVLTAGLRANPIVFIDAQQVPYGTFAPKSTGVPIQYDANIVHPFDLSGKRRARVTTATWSRRVIGARYQDAVRHQIHNLHNAYVDALVAQENAELMARKDFGRDIASRVPAEDPTAVLIDAQRTLAVLLNLPPAELARRRLRGRLDYRREDEPPLPAPPELAGIALANRPDLVALRHNVARADADIALAKANRFEDVLVLYQPYTFHDGRTGDFKNSVAWAAGLTVPLPLYNRQQGHIQKARLISVQARTQLASHEKTVAAEVQNAIEEHEAAHAAIIRTARDVSELQAIGQIDMKGRYKDDETVQRMLSVLEKLKDESYVEKLRGHGDAIVRHRRSMLRLNTVVGVRIMP